MLLKRLRYTQQFGHFLMQKSYSRFIGLYPFAIYDKLRDGALADMGDHFLGGACRVFNVDFRVGKIVFFQKAFGLAAVATPASSINKQSHIFMVNGTRNF